MSYEFLRMERVYEETNRPSYCCYILLDIVVDTLSGNHGTKPHLHPRIYHSPPWQTFGLPFYMHQIEIENYEWLPNGPLAEAQDNEKEATRCCYNNHCNIDGQSLHQGILECTSAIKLS